MIFAKCIGYATINDKYCIVIALTFERIKVFQRVAGLHKVHKEVNVCQDQKNKS